MDKYIVPGVGGTDLVEFHARMATRYALQAAQRRQTGRLIRLLFLFNLALVVMMSAGAVAYYCATR